MPDGVEALSKVSGLSRESIIDIWEDVKETMKKLDECSGPHDFQPDTSREPTAYEVCSKCGGKLSVVNARWYKKGLEHGKQGD